MADIDQIANMIATDFTAAVKAANKSRQMQAQNILAKIEDADAERRKGLADVRRMQEAAAKTVADSIRLAEKTEDRFHEAMREAQAELAALGGPSKIDKPGEAPALRMAAE